MRKRKKFIKSMKKAEGKANNILQNETYSDFSKAKQINELYRKAVK